MDLKNLALWVLAVAAVPALLVLWYLTVQFHGKVFPYYMFAVLLGMLVQKGIVIRQWKEIALNALLALLFSMLVFAPGKREYQYNLEPHLKLWPFFFCLMLVIVTLARYSKLYTVRLGEGITLLQSMAILYWLTAHGATWRGNAFVGGLAILALCFACYALYHGFSYRAHTPSSRFLLSLGSSLIMLCFAIDYVLRVRAYGDIDLQGGWGDVLFVGLQYFLLGVSALQLAQNAYMVLGFLPAKNEGRNYKRRIHQLRQDHIARYDRAQIEVRQALIAVLFCALIFGANAYFQFFPPTVAIWLVFFCTPYLVRFF
ncbi:hypothetical protein [Olivibacter sitiensis]|uniref:hypothetical protein n=1 Tax=Olivibacter sitiensis TaxID=376470 RepID=UPI0012FB04DF|nr:hypothetical protein [Olivibacter sitiensis]